MTVEFCGLRSRARPRCSVRRRHRALPDQSTPHRWVKNILWIELNRLGVKGTALFPLSLPASNTSQKFPDYGIVWILPTNRFELGLGAFIITLTVIFVVGLRQLRLDQLRPELYGHVQGLARRFTSLWCLTDIINRCQAVLAAQVRPSDGEFRVKPHCVLECVYRF